MPELQVNPYPHIHSGKSTHKYMLDLPITTYPMAIVAILFQFLYVTMFLDATFSEGIIVAIRAAIVIFVGVFSVIAAESIWNRYVKKEYNDFASWFRNMSITYPSITGMLYALSLPIGTPIYIVIIGGFVAVILGKSLFGGVGNNIFNPALVGRAFITIGYTTALSKAVDYTHVFSFLNHTKAATDVIATASPLARAAQSSSLLTYHSFLNLYSYGGHAMSAIWHLLLGFYPSALGESLSFWIILAFIYLSIKKTINWFVPLIYVGLVFLMTWAVALMNLSKLVDTHAAFGLQTLGIYFPLFHVLTGGLLFGAVFMATEPVTSPITKRGRAVFAVYLAIFTFAIRILGHAPEGVFYSILFMNMFVPVMDRFYMGQISGVKAKEIVLWVITALLAVGVTLYAGLGGVLG